MATARIARRRTEGATPPARDGEPGEGWAADPIEEPAPAGGLSPETFAPYARRYGLGGDGQATARA